MNTTDIINNATNIHSNIAADVWPDGWTLTCKKCGKEYHLTQRQCGHYLGHGGWPKGCPDCERKEGSHDQQNR